MKGVGRELLSALGQLWIFWGWMSCIAGHREQEMVIVSLDIADDRKLYAVRVVAAAGGGGEGDHHAWIRK